MSRDLSNITTIIMIYFFIFLKYLFFSKSYFDMQFFASSLLIGILVWINMAKNIISDKTKNIGKFMGHSLFISVCFSLVCSFISLIYNIIFFFGFVNTIVMVNIICMLLMSGLTNLFKTNMFEYLTKSNIGNKILDMSNYYYNTYIMPKKYTEKIMNLMRHIAYNYIWVCVKIMFNKFIKINSELSDNNQSENVKNNIDIKLSNAKHYFIEQILQPYFIKSFQDALENDPFMLANSSNNEILINSSAKYPYKSITSNKNMYMNFLANSNIDGNDDIDDLDEIDLKNVPEVSQKQLEDAEELEKKLIEENKKQEHCNEEKKAILKKKMAEKKALRTGTLNKKHAQQNFANIMNMPVMDQMMDTMLKGDNLEKILKQIPQEKIGKQASSFDPEQMKQLLKSINKKK